MQRLRIRAEGSGLRDYALDLRVWGSGLSFGVFGLRFEAFDAYGFCLEADIQGAKMRRASKIKMTVRHSPGLGGVGGWLFGVEGSGFGIKGLRCGG